MNRALFTECLLYATYMVFGISWAAAGALMPEIRHELHINLVQSSFITTSVTAAKIIGALGMVALLRLLGIRKSFIVGSLLISLSLLSAATQSFHTLLLIRFLMGLGGSMCLVCLVPIVQGLFDKRYWTRVNGINATTNVVGAIIALTTSNLLSNWFGWRSILSFWGLVSLFIMLLWVFFSADIDPHQQDTRANRQAHSDNYKRALGSRQTWGMVLFYVFVINYSISSFAYFPTYFQQYLHFTPHDLAAYTPSFLDAGLLVGCLSGAHVLARFNSIKPLLLAAVILCVLFGSIGLSALSQPVIVLMAALSGYVIGTILPRFLSLATTVKGTNIHLTGYIMSTFWCLTFIISTLNTWLMGVIADATGGFGWSFGYMFLLALVSFAGLLVMPRQQSARP